MYNLARYIYKIINEKQYTFTEDDIEYLVPKYKYLTNGLSIGLIELSITNINVRILHHKKSYDINNQINTCYYFDMSEDRVEVNIRVRSVNNIHSHLVCYNTINGNISYFDSEYKKMIRYTYACYKNDMYEK